MIEYFKKDHSKEIDEKVEECTIEFMKHDFEELYELYDKIKKKKIDILYVKSSNFLNTKNEKLVKKIKKINSKFMKECLLEAIRITIEKKSLLDINNKQSVLVRTIENYKKDFEYYPDTIENNVSEKIYSKKELRLHAYKSDIGKIEDKCNRNYFELAPHQLFLKNLISTNTNYKSLLVFHGVGVGKSCSAISIAENFKDIYADPENRIIILASSNIQIGWRKTIYDPSKRENQCTGSTYRDVDVSKETESSNKRKINKKIKKFYQLHGYSSFANIVKKQLKQTNGYIIDPFEKLKADKELIRKIYSNRVLIIDEVHNIRNNTYEDKQSERDTIHYIEMVIKYSDNLRLILLTANPMYNVVTEIVWILNMLLMNDKRNIIRENEIFDSEKNIVNPGRLQEISKGYVSYLRGENPVSFPIKLYPQHNKEYIIKTPGIKNDMFGNRIDSKLLFLELYSSNLYYQNKSTFQGKMYLQEVEKRSQKDGKPVKKLQIQDENILLQCSNIIFPNPNPTDETVIDEFYGETGLESCFTKTSGGVYSYKKGVPEFLKLQNGQDKINILRNYSCKLDTIIKSIHNSNGIVFIYTNWIYSGIIPLILALEQNGYIKYDNKKFLKTKDKIEPISYFGKTFEQCNQSEKEKFKPAKYMVITGGQDNLSNQLEKELKIATHSNNYEGKNIKIIIGSTVASEGLDFKNIRSIHILEPWHNLNKLEQVIGRGIRNCSHLDWKEPKERNVTVYLHTTKLLEENETIDTSLYRYSENKSVNIGIVETILKNNAIDKFFFKNTNKINEKDIETMKIKPAYRTSKEFPYRANDKDYSRVCSFLKCEEYSIPSKKIKINADTFTTQNTKPLIDTFKKRIANLFIQYPIYTIKEILQNLNDYVEVTDYEEYIYYALKSMIVDKYPVYNCNSEKGYLNTRDNYYLFQPYYNEDPNIPLYYRINKGIMKNNKYMIYETIKENYDSIKLETMNYSKEDILSVYHKLFDYQWNTYEMNVLKYLDLDTSDNVYKYSYLYDRLSYKEKIILFYSIFQYIHHNLNYFDNPEHMKLLIDILKDNLLQNESNQFTKVKDITSKKINYFFIYHNQWDRPLFFNYNIEGKIEHIIYEESEIINLLKKEKKQLPPFIGYCIFSDKHIDDLNNPNGIVMKTTAITTRKKFKINKSPKEGPGKITVTERLPTVEKIITNNIKEHIDYIDDKKDIDSSKVKEYVFFIEIYLRFKNLFISSDFIFIETL